MRFALVGAALVFFAPTVSRAGDYQAGVMPAVFAPNPHQSVGTLTIPVHSGWKFVGCSSSAHACTHHAHDHGFHHHMVQHNHSACPSHPHLACYGHN